MYRVYRRWCEESFIIYAAGENVRPTSARQQLHPRSIRAIPIWPFPRTSLFILSLPLASWGMSISRRKSVAAVYFSISVRRLKGILRDSLKFSWFTRLHYIIDLYRFERRANTIAISWTFPWQILLPRLKNIYGNKIFSSRGVNFARTVWSIELRLTVTPYPRCPDRDQMFSTKILGLLGIMYNSSWKKPATKTFSKVSLFRGQQVHTTVTRGEKENQMTR